MAKKDLFHREVKRLVERLASLDGKAYTWVLESDLTHFNVFDIGDSKVRLAYKHQRIKDIIQLIREREHNNWRDRRRGDPSLLG